MTFTVYITCIYRANVQEAVWGFFFLTIVATVTIPKIVCCVPGFVLKLLHALFHSIIPTTLGDSYNLHFKNKDPKVGQVE